MVLTPLASQGKADSETHAMPGLRGPALVFDYHTFIKYVTLFLKDEHDLFTFYVTFVHVSYNHGVHLKYLEDIQLDESLAPNHIDGVLLTKQQYHLMAGAIYDKLNSFDIVPMSYPEGCQAL